MSDVGSLLDCALELARADDAESESYWRVVAELHRTPVQEVFDRGVTWCESAVAAERRLGADVLGQLGTSEPLHPFRAATIPVLKQLLDDLSADVLHAALIATGHLGAGESVPEIAKLCSHADAKVRYGVAFALLGQESDLAIHTLIELSRDADEDVRDWSTFGLGAQVDTDTPEIRDALFARAEDPHADTRAEALSGLVKRGDRRALLPLRRAIASKTVGSLEVEAAAELGSKELLALLEELRSWWNLDPALLEKAIERCR